jgi:hypothetical protein
MATAASLPAKIGATKSSTGKRRSAGSTSASLSATFNDVKKNSGMVLLALAGGTAFNRYFAAKGATSWATVKLPLFDTRQDTRLVAGIGLVGIAAFAPKLLGKYNKKASIIGAGLLASFAIDKIGSWSGEMAAVRGVSAGVSRVGATSETSRLDAKLNRLNNLRAQAALGDEGDADSDYATFREPAFAGYTD